MMNATRRTTTAYGVVLAIAGMEHGVGEVLQGNKAPDAIGILSWPDSEHYEILAWEPAMTIIPNLLISGILTILLSILIIFWTVRYIHTKYGPLVLFGMLVLLLLVGGGYGPPIMGFIVVIFSTKINSDHKWLRTSFSDNLRNKLAKLWPYSLTVGILAYFSLWPGMVILSMLFGIADALLMATMTILAFTLLILSLGSSLVHDSVLRD